MDAQSVAAGVTYGIGFVVFVLVATGFFRQTILWTVEDKVRAEREDTRQKVEALRDEIRALRRDLDGLGRRVSCNR